MSEIAWFQQSPRTSLAEDYNAGGFYTEFMAEHQVPRWMNVLCVVLIICIVGSYVVVGVRRGYDLAQIIGFLAVYRVEIFGLAVLVALALYGLSFFIGSPRGRSPLRK